MKKQNKQTKKPPAKGGFERVEKVASGHFFEFLQGSACTPLAHTCPLRGAKIDAQVAVFCKLIKGRANGFFSLYRFLAV